MKIEFNDFIRESAEKYGMTLDEFHHLNNKTTILIFRRDERNHLVARASGEVIFVDRNSEHIIHDNEIWICTIEKSVNASYAKPLQQIDASFIFALKRDQIDELANIIWEKNQSTLEPRLEEKYRETMEITISKMAAESEEEFGKKKKELLEKIIELENTREEDKAIIESLQDRIKKAEEGSSKIYSETDSPSSSEITVDPFNIGKVHVRRIGPDQISSDQFKNSRYFVHVSADSRIMVLRPHESGNVVCVNKSISLAGLNIISPFNCVEDMMADYSTKFGGIRVLL